MSEKLLNSDSEIESVSGSEGSDSTLVEQIQADPIFIMLGHYFETEDGKNLATCVSELTQELRTHTEVLTKLLSALSTK